MSENHRGATAILCASAGLGTYSPAVQLFRYLTAHGAGPTFEVLESHLTVQRQARSLKARDKWQQNFQLALVAQRFLSVDDIGKDLDEERVSLLFDRWRLAEVSRFVLFSGFWLPILERYLAETKTEVVIECLQMDSVLGHSWARYLPQFTHQVSIQWLFSASESAVRRTVVPADSQRRQSARSVIIHGGGWQIGDYLSSLDDLDSAGYTLKVGIAGISQSLPISCTRFCIDPVWNPWDCAYPELAPHLVKSNNDETWQPSGSGWFVESVQGSDAIISKPGGATLLDSLTFAVPLVLCEPYGDVEQHNSELWVRMGFGIRLSDWKYRGYEQDSLEVLHRNLLQHQQLLSQSVAEELNAK